MISIQPFQKKYQGQILPLILEIQQKEFHIKISSEQQPDLQDISGFYQKDNGNFWIALEKDKVVGTIALLDIGKDACALRKMFVHKEYRGAKGVAKQLLEEALKWAKSKKVKRIFLGTTSAFVAAHRFYEKNGFVEIRKEDLPKTFPLMSVDSKFYMLTFL
jgi:N-acetylglutamate synthase-like GNAT family acetyltransferase